jgi:hypothetical protein
VGVIEGEHKVDWWEREEGDGGEGRKTEVYSNLKIHLLQKQQQRHCRKQLQ